MRSNIIWITLESVRADYTSMGASDVSATPNINQIAAAPDGRWFDNCYSHARWTPASTASILTGTYLSTHGVGYEDTTEVSKIPPDLSTVPELLSELGYRTGCFSGNAYVSHATGVNRGFDTFDDCNSKADVFSLSGAKTLLRYLVHSHTVGGKTSLDPARHKDCLKEWYQAANFRRWIRTQQSSEQPYFAYLHLNNSHHPYRPPLAILEECLDGSDLTPAEAISISDEYSDTIWERIATNDDLDSTEQEAILAAYEGEIRYSDYFVGEIFDYVKDRDDTVVVITGDHGELFGERGVFGHNLVLHDKILNVPLVTYGLDLPTGSSDEFVQHMDVMQTLVDTVGGDTSQFQGYNLTTENREFVIAERGPRGSDLEKLAGLNPAFDSSRYHGPGIRCLRSEEWKYQESSERAELFRLPDETTDVASEFPRKKADLADRLDALIPTTTVENTERADFDSEMRDRLRHMGYID